MMVAVSQPAVGRTCHDPGKLHLAVEQLRSIEALAVEMDQVEDEID